MRYASVRLVALATAMGLSSASAFAAQPVIVGHMGGDADSLRRGLCRLAGPEPDPEHQGRYDYLYQAAGQPSGRPVGCLAQVDWFDWNGVPAGVSGGPGATPTTLLANRTLEFTTSSNANPNNYPNFQENVFRDAKDPFEGYAQVRIQCPAGAAGIKALRVDAEFATFDPTTPSPI